MEQFSIHIHGNNSPTSIEFVEKQYKLGAGETLVGKADDFPEKKSLAGLFDIEAYVEGWKVAEGEYSIITGGLGSSNQIDLKSILNTLFPVESGEARADRGITCEIDFFFFVNHIYTPAGDGQIVHMSATANKLMRLNILKTVTDAGNEFWAKGSKIISESGHWVSYDSTSTYFASVIDDGELSSGAFTLSLDLSSGNLYLNVTSNLRSETDWNVNPEYRVDIKYKLRMLNYAMPNANRTTEYTSETGK